MPLGRDDACIKPQVVYCSLIFIGAHRIMLVLMQLRFHKLGGVPIISQCSRDWWKVRYCLLLILAVFMLSGRMFPSVICSVVSMAIVPQDQGARGKSACIAMRLTLRNGGIGGAGRP